MSATHDMLKAQIALSAQNSAGTFDHDNKIKNPNDFAHYMLELTTAQSTLGFHKQDTSKLRENVCRAAAFKNTTALDGFCKALPDALSKKTWIPVPSFMMDLPIYPSKEHREQDTFRLYAEMALKTAKDEAAFLPSDRIFAPEAVLGVFRRVSKGIESAYAEHAPHPAGFVPITYGY